MFLFKPCNIKGICWQCYPAMSCCSETEKTPSNKEHHLPSAVPATLRRCTKLPVIRPQCASFQRQPHNWVPKSHEITNVNRHITYVSRKLILTEFCWVLLIKHAFCRRAVLKTFKVKFQYHLGFFWFLTHWERPTAKWYHFSWFTFKFFNSFSNCPRCISATKWALWVYSHMSHYIKYSDKGALRSCQIS